MHIPSIPLYGAATADQTTSVVIEADVPSEPS